MADAERASLIPFAADQPVEGRVFVSAMGHRRYRAHRMSSAPIGYDPSDPVFRLVPVDWNPAGREPNDVIRSAHELEKAGWRVES